jgi:hypothetical protein
MPSTLPQNAITVSCSIVSRAFEPVKRETLLRRACPSICALRDSSTPNPAGHKILSHAAGRSIPLQQAQHPFREALAALARLGGAVRLPTRRHARARQHPSRRHPATSPAQCHTPKPCAVTYRRHPCAKTSSSPQSSCIASYVSPGNHMRWRPPNLLRNTLKTSCLLRPYLATKAGPENSF